MDISILPLKLNTKQRFIYADSRNNILIYTADYIITMNGPPIKNGAIQVHENRIQKVGPRGSVFPKIGEQTQHFRETVLMPGLINCHSQLELGGARGVFPQREPYSMWTARLVDYKQKSSLNEFANAVRLGVLESIRTGTTTVFDHSNTGITYDILPSEFIRSNAVYEYYHPGYATGMNQLSNQIQYLKKLTTQAFPEKCRPGFGIHSLFSCSADLIKSVIDSNSDFKIPFSMNLDESEEEWKLYIEQNNRLFERLCRKHNYSGKEKYGNPITFLDKNKMLPEFCMLTHCNHLEKSTAEILSNKNISIVHCPRSNTFFGHTVFPYELCFNYGINVCLGTDSLASNENLNMFEEMAEFKRIYPQVICEDILEMTTVNGAKALRRENSLGKIKENFLADIIGINLIHDQDFDLYDEIVCEEHEVILSIIDGKEVMI